MYIHGIVLEYEYYSVHYIDFIQTISYFDVFVGSSLVVINICSRLIVNKYFSELRFNNL
jgi:hypothetical protein